jgi:hypothetical protein
VFDFGKFFKPGYAYSQLGEGGGNAAYNCVPTSFMQCLMALGYPEYKPEDVTDGLYGKIYVGGEDFLRVRDWFAGRITNPPDMRVSNPADTIGAIRDAAAAGFPTIVEVRVDVNVNLVTAWTGHTHASVVVAEDARPQLAILNVWKGAFQWYDEAFFRQVTLSPAGNLVVFARRFPQLTPPTAPVPVPDKLAEAKALAQQIIGL